MPSRGSSQRRTPIPATTVSRFTVSMMSPKASQRRTRFRSTEERERSCPASHSSWKAAGRSCSRAKRRSRTRRSTPTIGVSTRMRRRYQRKASKQPTARRASEPQMMAARSPEETGPSTMRRMICGPTRLSPAAVRADAKPAKRLHFTGRTNSQSRRSCRSPGSARIRSRLVGPTLETASRGVRGVSGRNEKLPTSRN